MAIENGLISGKSWGLTSYSVCSGEGLRVMTPLALIYILSAFSSKHCCTAVKTGWVCFFSHYIVLVPPVVAPQLWFSKHHKYGCRLPQPDNLFLIQSTFGAELENGAAQQIGADSFSEIFVWDVAYENPVKMHHQYFTELPSD